jgi:hypothetical protein
VFFPFHREASLERRFRKKEKRKKKKKLVGGSK